MSSGAHTSTIPRSRRDLNPQHCPAQVQYKTPFAPIMPGSVTATYLDLDSAAQAIVKGRTAAVFVEPIQGEGGVTPANTCALRPLCFWCWPSVFVALLA